MQLLILYTLLQTLSGSIAGYLTNTYAINMLFKEYTFFKVGGVILKTKDQFIEKISSLIEDEVLNESILKAELSKEAFLLHMESIILFLQKEALKNVTGKTLVNYLEVKELLSVFLDSKQARECSRNISTVIFDIGKNTEKTLGEILPRDFTEKMQGYVEVQMPQVVENVNRWIHQNKEEIEKLIEQAIEEEINQASGLKGTILKTLKGYILEHMAKGEGPVGVLIQQLASGENTKELSKQLSDEIRKATLKLTIRKIMLTLEERKIMTRESLDEMIWVLITGHKEQIIDFAQSWIEKQSILQENGVESMPTAKSMALLLQKTIVFNSEKILNGTVKKIITSNLQQLDEKTLCELVQDFMGRELKPIATFGGVLGGLIGFACGVMGCILGGATIAFAPLRLFIYIPAFALIGYLTNVIALQMIFKPYKKNLFLGKIWGLRIFSQGYIGKNKQKFVVNMAKFVDEGLLEKETIARSFSKKEQSFTHFIFANLSKDHYRRARVFAQKHGEQMITAFCRAIKEPMKKQLLTHVFSEEGIDRCKDKLNEILIEKASSQVPLGESFHGGFRQFTQSKREDILQQGVQMLLGKLEKSQEEITFDITASLKSKLGFLEMAGYTMMDGDQMVGSVVSRCIFEEAPEFLQKKKTEIDELMQGIMETYVYTLRPCDLGIMQDTTLLEELMDGLVKKPDNQGKLQAAMSDLLDQGIKVMEEVPLARWIKLSETDMDILAKYMIEKVFMAVKRELPSILGELDVKDLTSEQMDNMDERKIHEMFLSFAGKYFKRLEIYGLFGGIFGIHPLLSPVLGIVGGIQALGKKSAT